MNKELREAKAYLKGIATKEELNSVLDSIVLSTRDREIVGRLYLQQEGIDYIADNLSYSSVTIKRVNHDFLVKLSCILDK